MSKGDKGDADCCRYCSVRQPRSRFGPDGDSQHPSAQKPDPTFVLPEALAGKLLIKAGEHIYGIGSGGSDWEVPADGEISFIFNDTNVASEYANNTGGYDVRFVVLG